MSEVNWEDWRKLPYIVYKKHFARFRFILKEEFIQAGNIALWEATKVFDPTRGVPFHVFASVRVTWRMRDVLKERRWGTARYHAKVTALSPLAELPVYQTDPCLSDVWDTVEKTVSQKVQTILRCYFQLGYSYQKTGEILSLSKQRIQYAVNKSLEVLRPKFLQGE